MNPARKGKRGQAAKNYLEQALRILEAEPTDYMMDCPGEPGELEQAPQGSSMEGVSRDWVEAGRGGRDEDGLDQMTMSAATAEHGEGELLFREAYALMGYSEDAEINAMALASSCG